VLEGVSSAMVFRPMRALGTALALAILCAPALALAEDAKAEKAEKDAVEVIDDDVAEAPVTEAPKAEEKGAQKPAKSAILELSDAEIAKRVRTDLASLGPMSVGQCGAGALVNGVQMPKGEGWLLMDGSGSSWGTQETIDFLQTAIAKVRTQFPSSHKLFIGDISMKSGGYFVPHKSHQSGRDVDISYYYKVGDKNDARWYRRATAANLDRARTWAFVRALITETDVQYIFMNTSVQKLVKEFARSAGEDDAWLDSIFQVGNRGGAAPIILHAEGHDTHIHIRFFNPIAQEVGRRAHDALVKNNVVKPRANKAPGAAAAGSAPGYKRHKARKGDLLGNLAKRYGTTVEAIRKANGLKNDKIRAGRTYVIPVREEKAVANKTKAKTKAKPVKTTLAAAPKAVIPPRRLPPSSS
jgi:murein endopeptidase/LysM repeat protein